MNFSEWQSWQLWAFFAVVVIFAVEIAIAFHWHEKRLRKLEGKK